MIVSRLRRAMNRRGFLSRRRCCPTTCPATVCATGCGGGAVSGAAVTIAEPISGYTAAGTTGGSGCATFEIPRDLAGDTFNIAIAATGYVDYSGSQSLGCGGTATIALTSTGPPPSCLVFTVGGCCCIPIEGASVSITGPVSASGTTDVHGQWTHCTSFPAGTYTWTASADRFQAQTGTFDIASCSSSGNTIGVCLEPAAGYACGFNPSGWPSPATLPFTESIHGGGSLTYSSASGNYTGSIGGLTYPAVTDSAGACPSSPGWTATYTLSPGPNCEPTLCVSYHCWFCGACQAPFGVAWNSGLVPRDPPATFDCAYGDPSSGSTVQSWPNPRDNSKSCCFDFASSADTEATDLTFTKAALPDCGTGTYDCECCGATPIARDCCPCAPWGAGATITVTE